MSEKNYDTLSDQILELVGGKQNVTHLLHCATRLRFNIADYDQVDIEGLKKLNGTLGVQKVGEQLQVIIGPDVSKVYDILQTRLETEFAAQANTSAPAKKKKITLKSIGSSILDALSGCLGPVIPAIVACAFFKMIPAILGPGMLNWITEESSLYILCTFVGDAGFYFFPVLIGLTAAKKFGVTPVLGVLLGCIMMHPTLVSMATEGVNDFTVFGIPCLLQNYGSTVIPIILNVWVMSYIEKFFNKKIPSSLRNVFAPALTIAVMLPISLCILGPLGSYLGTYVVGFLLGLGNYAGFIATALIAGLYPLLVMTGMHMMIIAALFQVFATVGYDGVAAPALTISAFAVMGTAIGAALALKNKAEKAEAAEFAITAVLAGTSEPTLYGICARYKSPFLGLLGGGFIGGLYSGLTGVISATLVPSTNLTSLLCFTGASSANLINGVIASVLALVSSAVITFIVLRRDQKKTALA
ncbi:PTS transporter subunit EIIC [Allobaculum sp. JKK-2023]|uniref:PTS transporter subunit EIIC n=1 Tax=Allobaculum sp. JKK-2023 TaxID=3108943 RepID=UPI002B051A57|nr:PTS transporter subunit EIIC [Allobaculum sp. JKK-2023]